MRKEPSSSQELRKSDDARGMPRRIALVRREAPAQLLEDRSELVTTAPHLLLREVIVFQICVIVLAIVSILFDAPLEGIADPEHTPNPAKAPWYFLGLQELLHYFPPIVAGVLIPGLVVLAIGVMPYFRVNWESTGLYEQPWKKTIALVSGIVAVSVVIFVIFHTWVVLVPTLVIYGLMILPGLPFCPARLRGVLGRVHLADWIMTWFVIVAILLTLTGVFFRGPGWSFVWPWQGGTQ